MKKIILLIIVFVSAFSNLKMYANEFPAYSNVVAVDEMDSHEIYTLIKGYLSKLSLIDFKEISSDEDKRQISISGNKPFTYTYIVSIPGKVIMNIDFYIKDGRFKYDLVVTDVITEGSGGMQQSVFNYLQTSPQKKTSKAIFPHVEKITKDLMHKIETINTKTNDDW